MLFVILQSEKRSDSRKAIACLQPLIVLLGSEFAHFHLGLEAGYNLSNLVEKKKKEVITGSLGTTIGKQNKTKDVVEIFTKFVYRVKLRSAYFVVKLYRSWCMLYCVDVHLTKKLSRVSLQEKSSIFILCDLTPKQHPLKNEL